MTSSGGEGNGSGGASSDGGEAGASGGAVGGTDGSAGASDNSGAGGSAGESGAGGTGGSAGSSGSGGTAGLPGGASACEVVQCPVAEGCCVDAYPRVLDGNLSDRPDLIKSFEYQSNVATAVFELQSNQQEGLIEWKFDSPQPVDDDFLRVGVTSMNAAPYTSPTLTLESQAGGCRYIIGEDGYLMSGRTCWGSGFDTDAVEWITVRIRWQDAGIAIISLSVSAVLLYPP